VDIFALDSIFGSVFFSARLWFADGHTREKVFSLLVDTIGRTKEDGTI
jgi:hypothetical protein